MIISPARIAAFKVLQRIERDRAYSSVLLPQFEQTLAPSDRGLCHELVLGTLRRQIYLDRVISHFSGVKRLDLAVRISLRLGLYQLFFLDRIPPHSAVNDSVGLVQMARKTSAKGFVNAILRKASTARPELTFDDDIDRISVETSHPRWMIERWGKEFGPEMAEQLASTNNTAPRSAFRLLNGSEPEIPGASASEFVPGCYLIDNIPGDPSVFAGTHNVYFQDEGSQMVAAAVSVPDGGRFLDVCAAPGGKTGSIAKSGSLGLAVAGDLHWPRIELLRENLRQQGPMDVHVIQYNAQTGLPFADRSFDTVFVDAPCSGTGTIRSNPEIRYFLTPHDIDELSLKQLSILMNASKLVGDGGSLIYSTCSLEYEENEQVCERFISASSSFYPQQSKLPERFRTGEGYARTFPHRDRMDGFFIAELRRN